MNVKILMTMALWVIPHNIDGSDKLKLCLVNGKGVYKPSTQLCPLLNAPESRAKCVIGIDRLDCLRRMTKGKVDLSVFTSEDLMTATNSDIDVLITNELHFTEDKYEYEVVAIVSDTSGITSRHDLRDKKFCHPGFANDIDWTKILSDHFEEAVVPLKCDPNFTLIENRIRSSSLFFKSACKAGPWVYDEEWDAKLKKKYPNLCELCDNSYRCSKQDKYWGRRGPLYCLTDGAGDIAWARLDDVQVHFGLKPGGAETTPNGYSYLCPDGTKLPLSNGTSSSSCVWVVKPWPVIATRRDKSEIVQELIPILSHKDRQSWQSVLLSLLENFHLTIETVQPPQDIDGYLSQASGYLSANSFTGCHPPRTIWICTTSNRENAKCSWLRESASVYGVEPDFDCVKADNKTQCMHAINTKPQIANVVIVPPNHLKQALHEFNLTTIFYETTTPSQIYKSVAVTLKNSRIKSIQDLKGTKACFPQYDDISWNSLAHYLEKCPNELAEYFSDICAPDYAKSTCESQLYRGDLGAIQCLLRGVGDVAFLNQNDLEKYIYNARKNQKNYKLDDFRILCPLKDVCHLSWSPLGYGMVHKNNSQLQSEDILDAFLNVDFLFGKQTKSITNPLEIFGEYDGDDNVLFHDATVKIRNVPYALNLDNMPILYEDLLLKRSYCINYNSAAAFQLPIITTCTVICLILYLF